MTIEIGPASREDAAEVLSILDDAAEFLQAIGVSEQWPSKISTDATWTKLLYQLLANQSVFLACQDGDPIGVFHLCDTPQLGDFNDPTWDDVSGRALYLYIFAVRRSVAGKGIARAMLDWACLRAASSKRALRLDCWAGNSRLRQYYLNAGFQELADLEIQSSLDGRTYSVSRFQRAC